MPLLSIRPIAKGGSIINCRVLNCNAAVNLEERAEYINIIGGTFSNSNVGLGLGAGNFKVDGSIIENNVRGIKVYNGTNNGHGSINAIVNHSSLYALDVQNISQPLGITFTGQIYYGAFFFKDAKNFTFSNTNASSLDSIHLDNSCISVTNTMLGMTTGGAAIPVYKYNGACDIAVTSGRRFNEATPIVSVREVYEDTTYSRNVVFDKGNAIASTSPSDSVWVRDAITGQRKLRSQSDIGGGGSTSSGFRILNFTIDSTAYAPTAGMNYLKYPSYQYKFLKIYREGERLKDSAVYENGFYRRSDTIYFTRVFVTNEHFIIEAYDTTNISYDGFVAPPSGYETEVDTYIAAVVAAGGTLSTGQKDAYNDWVVAEKSAGRYSKYTAIYPFMGGNAASHAINAANPGSHNLTFSGSWTHDGQGSDPSSGASANRGVFAVRPFSKQPSFLCLYQPNG